MVARAGEGVEPGLPPAVAPPRPLSLELPRCTVEDEQGFCLGRKHLNKMNAIIKSERRAREGLIKCREECARPQISGVDPWVVVVISVGAFVVGAAAAGTVVYFASR